VLILAGTAVYLRRWRRIHRLSPAT
jgi:hypothetical protein